MSLRPPVDRQRIQHFLEVLGRRFHGAGRVYLVGGTMLDNEGFRTQTLDIDLTYELATPEEAAFIRTLRTLKQELALNIEAASPADFIPLPGGYASRAQFIGRFGQLEVFHFDPYSVALSKIARGQDADFADVLALLARDWLVFKTLETYFAEILPQVGVRSLKADPEEFSRKFAYLKAQWQAQRP